MFNQLIHSRLKQLEARQAARFLLRLEVAFVILKLVQYLVIAIGVFWLYTYLSETTLVLTAQMNDAMQISGKLQQVGPVDGLLGSLLAFFLAFLAGALFVEPLQNTWDQLHNLKKTKYLQLSQRMPDIIEDNCVPSKWKEVKDKWFKINLTVQNTQNFEELASFMPALLENLKP